MYLVIGGSHQGKLEWVLQHFALSETQVKDAAALDLSLTEPLALGDCRVLNGLALLLRRAMQQGWSGKQLLELQSRLLQLPEDTIIICDSVGGGLVPVEKFERDWRELVGRTCCQLASAADGVWRIFCGLPQRLK